MSDPLSVAGSAVGIISLGIQVCQGLIQYADVIRGQRRDVDDGMDEVRSLLAIFKSLEQTITRIETESPENAKSLLEHLRRAEAKLQSLEEVLTEVGIPVNTSSSIKGKMKETYRAAIYPMKKSKLDGARQNVQSLLGILTATVQTVDLDLGISQSDALTALQASTTCNASELKAAIEVNSTQLESLQVTSRQDVSDVNMSLISTRAEVQAFSIRSASQLDSVGSDVREGLENIQLLVGMMRDLSLQINAASTTSRSVGSHNQTALFMATLGSRIPPSSLKQACDLYATDTNLIPGSSRNISGLPQPRRRRRYCKCPPRPERRDDFLSTLGRGAYFERTTISEHDVGCRFAKLARKISTTKAGARFRVQLGGLFSTLVDVSMCLTTGAGGFSLSPCLRYVRILAEIGPVSRLLFYGFHPKPTFDVSGQAEKVVDKLLRLRRQITTCFEQGTASPHDIEPSVSAPYYTCLLVHLNMSLTDKGFDKEALRVALDIMQWLADVSALEMAKKNVESWVFASFNRWQSLLSRLPDNDKNEAVALDFLRRLLDTIEPGDEFVIKLIISSSLDYIHQFLISYIRPDASPMAWAILSRSIPELEYQLKLAPASVFERTYGYTTLQLANLWPQGFTRLVQTGARVLLHEPMPNEGNLLFPFDSLDSGVSLASLALSALLDVGYTLFPNNYYSALGCLLFNSTDTTAPVIARHLSERLRRLSELASNSGIILQNDPSVPDFATAARWCLALDELGELIDPSIRVPTSDDMVPTVYHFPPMPLRFFPLFYEHGFAHAKIHDRRGLPSMFVGRLSSFQCRQEYFLAKRVPNGKTWIFHNISWLRQHGFLGQKPHDPLGLGLNVDATGVHRLAAEMGSDLDFSFDYQQDVDHYLSLAANLLRQLAKDSHRDKCVCWCNFDGDGCSPLKLLYKSHAHTTNPYRGIRVWKQYEFQTKSVKRLLLDFSIFDDPTTPTPSVKQQREREQTTKTQPSTRALELVRFLTFEALEMTHTCCMLDNLGKNHNNIDAILNCDPSTVRDIRQSEEERKNAALLDTLMEEFSNAMQQDYQAKSLLDFIFSYWTTRIEDLYAVRKDEVQKMQQHVSNVRTGIWPRPLRRLLWPTHPRAYEETNSDGDGIYGKDQEGEYNG